VKKGLYPNGKTKTKKSRTKIVEEQIKIRSLNCTKTAEKLKRIRDRIRLRKRKRFKSIKERLRN
jgi:hypothetical protein